MTEKELTIHASQILNRAFSISQKALSWNWQDSSISIHEKMRIFPIDPEISKFE